MGLKGKYLAIRILGHNTIYAYFNDEHGVKDGTNRPLFKNNGVAVWLNEEKVKPQLQEIDVKGTDWDEFI